MSWKIIPATEFSFYRNAWDCLNRQVADSPLLDSRFVAALLKHFGTGKEKLIIAGDASKPVAMGIILKVKFGVWSTFQPAQAPIGLWLHSPESDLEHLLGSLYIALPNLSLLVGITQQDPLINPRPEDNACIATIDYIQTAHINIDKDFEDYWSSRGKNLRHNLKRQRNRLKRETITTRLEVFDQAWQMPLAVSQYGNMESSGWKNTIGSAVHIDNPQGQFYIEALSAMAETKQTRCYRYFYNDKLVASDLCVLGGEILVILKTTYDESIESSSPTLLMREEAFRQLFDEAALKRIEFYGKLMEWHLKWNDETRVIYHINYYPWKIVRILQKFLRPSRSAYNMER